MVAATGTAWKQPGSKLGVAWAAGAASNQGVRGGVGGNWSCKQPWRRCQAEGNMGATGVVSSWGGGVEPRTTWGQPGLRHALEVTWEATGAGSSWGGGESRGAAIGWSVH